MYDIITGENNANGLSFKSTWIFVPALDGGVMSITQLECY